MRNHPTPKKSKINSRSRLHSRFFFVTLQQHLGSPNRPDKSPKGSDNSSDSSDEGKQPLSGHQTAPVRASNSPSQGIKQPLPGHQTAPVKTV